MTKAKLEEQNQKLKRAMVDIYALATGKKERGTKAAVVQDLQAVAERAAQALDEVL